MPCGGPPDSAPGHVGNMERQLSGVFPELEALAERMLHLRCRTRWATSSCAGLPAGTAEPRTGATTRARR